MRKSKNLLIEKEQLINLVASRNTNKHEKFHEWLNKNCGIKNFYKEFFVNVWELFENEYCHTLLLATRENIDSLKRDSNFFSKDDYISLDQLDYNSTIGLFCKD